MAKKGFSLDFDGFLDLAREIDNMGEGLLHEAVDRAFTASKDFVNDEIEKAMDASKYHFDGTGYSKGKTKASLHKIEEMPVEWNGTVATARIGVDLKEAPEVLFIMNGTPHLAKDTKLHNAVKVKGAIKKEVERIQAEEFSKVLAEAQNGTT